MHKTATSFLQEVFFPALKGIQYIHHNQHQEFTDYMRFTDPLLFDAGYARELVMRRVSEQKVLLSHEMFCGTPWEGGLQRKRLIDNLISVFEHLNLILVIRNPVDLLNSMYLQFIKSGGTLSPNAFLSYRKTPFAHGFGHDYYNPQPLVNYIREQLGADSLLILVYEEFLRARSDYFAKLHSFLGATLESEVDFTHKVNESISPRLVWLTLIANRIFSNKWNPCQFLPSSAHPVEKRIILSLSRMFPTKVGVFNNVNSADYLKSALDGYRQLDSQFNLNLQKYGYYNL